MDSKVLSNLVEACTNPNCQPSQSSAVFESTLKGPLSLRGILEVWTIFNNVNFHCDILKFGFRGAGLY
jgi:hypothetical protein